MTIAFDQFGREPLDGLGLIDDDFGPLAIGEGQIKTGFADIDPNDE